jgi:hypothetical protein
MATEKKDAKVIRNPAYKKDLDLKIIKGLKLSQMPVGYDKAGKLLFGPNPPVNKAGEVTGPMIPSYIVWDSHQSAPPGFGIRVAAKKTYILRRKVLGRSLMPNVGNFGDFATIDDARKKAAAMALKMVETGKNPNVEARRVAASEFTLGMALERYRTHLTTRTQKPAKVETLKVHDRVVRRFTECAYSGDRDRLFRSIVTGGAACGLAHLNCRGVGHDGSELTSFLLDFGF